MTKIQQHKKRILVAPLHWGIGHATRCIPVINALIQQNFEPIIASDGDALTILQKTFPDLRSYELPSYDITYAKNSRFFKMVLLGQIPKILKVVKREYALVQEIVKKEDLAGIISDNRFGVRSDKVPSVYITHQVKVLSGITTFFTSKIHQRIIKKFDACWVPDNSEIPKFSGKLSSSNSLKNKTHFIGTLSRFNKNTAQSNYLYDILILLSGPEPQRSKLEEKLINVFKNTSQKVLFIRGIITNDRPLTNTKNITYKNYLLQDELENAIIKSNVVIARSGYSTIMDLAALQKKAFFIPTPRQSEQEYLAKHLEGLSIAPYSTQKDFSVSKLQELKKYKGFTKETNGKMNVSFDLFK